jgi:hypothetical protein
MSYAANRWTSDYSLSHIFGAASYSIIHLPTHTALADDDSGVVHGGPGRTAGPTANDPVLMVQGMINGAVKWLPFIRFPANAAVPERITESAEAEARAARQTEPYRLILSDAVGNTLVDNAIEAKRPPEFEVTEHTFAQFVPCPPQVRAARLMQGGRRLAERLATPHPPSVELGPVSLGDKAQRTLLVSWGASDPDGDPLLFTLQYTPDAGATWHTLRLNSALFSAVVDAETLPGSETARLRLIATDGFNSTMALSAPFAMPKRSPVPIISGVTEGALVAFGSHLELHGAALDAEDGSAVASLRWNLDGPTTGTAEGFNFLLDELSPGDYRVQLTATDRDKQTGMATRNFSITPMPIPEGSTPVLDGKCDPPYRSAAFVRIPLGDGKFATARLLHASSNLFICFTDLQLPVLPHLPKSVGVRVDVDADATPLGEPGDVGFFVNSSGIPYQEAGTGTNMSETLSPQLGFSARIFRGSNSWSAELRIAESVLGGWNHRAGLMLDHGTPHWPQAATDDAPASWAPAWLRASVPSPKNRAPVAVTAAPATLSAAEPRVVVLDGSASYDPDGDALSYAWRQIGGPAVTLTNTKTAHPSFTAKPAPTNQVYSFSLVVSDRALESEPVETTVTVLPAIRGGRLERAQCFAVGETIQLRFPGAPGESYILQGTFDLKAWMNLRTNVADELGAAEFIEHDAGQYPARFYRTLISGAR